MSFDSNVGIAGLVLACLGIAFTILWPKKWVGWSFLFLAVLLGIYWGYLYVWKRPSSEKGRAGSPRPYISIAAIGFPDIILKPGSVIIKWDIKNSVAGPQATIVEANMGLWYASSRNPLPAKPQYIPTPHKLTGITLAPGEVFQATFIADRDLTESDVVSINKGMAEMYAFGYVKYKGETATEYTKGFIAVYKPQNNPQFGMFSHYEQINYNYDK